jgi:hypothetical protein
LLRTELILVGYHPANSPIIIAAHILTDLGIETHGQHRIEIRTPTSTSVGFPLHISPDIPLISPGNAMTQRNDAAHTLSNAPEPEFMSGRVIDFDLMDLDLSTPRLDDGNIPSSVSISLPSHALIETNTPSDQLLTTTYESITSINSGGVLSPDPLVNLPYQWLVPSEAPIFCVSQRDLGGYSGWSDVVPPYLRYSPGK